MFTTCQLVFDVSDVSDVIEIVCTVYKLRVGNPLLFEPYLASSNYRSGKPWLLWRVMDTIHSAQMPTANMGALS